MTLKRRCEYNAIPTFSTNQYLCFLDGSVHNNPDQQKLDQVIINTLRDYGIDYRHPLTIETISANRANQDIFERGNKKPIQSNIHFQIIFFNFLLILIFCSFSLKGG